MSYESGDEIQRILGEATLRDLYDMSLNMDEFIEFTGEELEGTGNTADFSPSAITELEDLYENYSDQERETYDLF